MRSSTLPVPGEADRIDLPAFLIELEPSALVALAGVAERIAAYALERARWIEQRRRSSRESERRLEELRRSPELVATLISTGTAYPAAVRAVADRLEAPVETIDHHCRAADHARSKTRITARRFRVAALIAKGRKETEIAAELGVSLRTVERTVRDLKTGITTL